MRTLRVVRSGLVPYEDALELQHRLEQARADGAIDDVVLMLEHPPVYTKGRRATDAELPMGEDWYRARGIEIVQTDRGGQVTYHGPGQLVAYPIMNLRELAHADDVHAFVVAMETAIIGSLADVGVTAGLVDGLTGVWVDGERKIGSIGIHVRRGITTHGLAVNVSNDLQPFEWVVPCGIEQCRMTSITGELGSEYSLESFATRLGRRLGEVYGREAIDSTLEEALGSLSLSAS